MNTTKTLHAVLIGINNYPSNPLAGCINDVLAINEHFTKLCDAQEEEVHWRPKFLLAPLSGEVEILQQHGIEYTRPSRQNIIDAFDHFQSANAEQGDYCLLYYSGHGSFIYTDRMLLFDDYENSSQMQSLVCLDENDASKKIHHLLDKELGFLITKSLKGENPTKEEDEKPTVHFLSIMDCCHSGTNTRSHALLTPRMCAGDDVIVPKVPLGFTKTGNCFYRPFKDGQKKVQKGDLTPARHISLSGSQSSESAFEMPLSLSAQKDNFQNIRHGIFTVSLLKTLEQSGTNISYGELMQRVQMEVKSRVSKQIPYLDSMMLEDKHLYFLQNKFIAPQQEYLIAFREKPHPAWILGAGAIQGITFSNSENTTLQLTDGSERIIEIKEVRATESVLDSTAFTEADKSNKLLRATIHNMVFPTVHVAFGKDLSKSMREQIIIAWEKNPPIYLHRVENNIPHQFEITPIKNGDDSESFILTRLEIEEKDEAPKNSNDKNKTPLFKRHNNANVFLRDAEKVARYETIINRSHPDSTILREDFDVKINALEGKEFNADTLNDIPINEYSNFPINPDKVKVSFKEIDGEYMQPAIKVSITCNDSMKKTYWIGALYCDAQFGITDQYLQVQQIGKNQTDMVELEFRMEEHGVVNKWQAIPLNISDEWRSMGVTQITDYILIFISDAHQPFSLEKYNQDVIELDTKRGVGFRKGNKPKKDAWRTIKIPIDIFWEEER